MGLRFRAGARVDVQIDGTSERGSGVGRVGRIVTFVRGALPGEHVEAEITKVKRRSMEARLLSVLQPSPKRIAPKCALFGTCGGCTFQHLAYEDQLAFKQDVVQQAVNKGLGEGAPPVQAIHPSPLPWGYRNKMEFSFGRDEDDTARLGFHRPGRFDRVFDVDRCHIHPSGFDQVLAVMREHQRTHGLGVWDPVASEGFLRHLVVRHGKHQDKVIAVLVTTAGELPDAEGLWNRLRDRVPGFGGLLWVENNDVADVARWQSVRASFGDPHLVETLNDLEFDIAPQAFFQTNSSAAALLYSEVTRIADLGPGALVMDAYCGTGAIGLHCARQGAEVVGVEIVEEAVDNARANAQRNGVTNTQFVAAPMAQGLAPAVEASGGRPFSHVIVDPPRGGMDRKSLRGLLRVQAPTLVYVSCNPAVLAMDLAKLAEFNYVVDHIQPVDMFPHTFHVETIVRARLPAEA